MYITRLVASDRFLQLLHSCPSTKMYLQALASILTLGSTAFAAQLTQVSNYGGTAKAKPGMWATLPSSFAHTLYRNY